MELNFEGAKLHKSPCKAQIKGVCSREIYFYRIDGVVQPPSMWLLQSL
jgi:hypothetical protein